LHWLWLWRFLFYSFCGFLLEVVFARVTHHPKKDRKCLLLLPLCPVYGLGAALILWFSQLLHAGPLAVMVIGFFSATAAEYLMAGFYERVLGVRFWDYARMPLNLDGRVCLLFSGLWTVLALALVYAISPLADRFLILIPAWLGPPALILLLSDVLVSSVALRRTGTTEVLRWYRP
jgi:uncharacterized membrane protein